MSTSRVIVIALCIAALAACKGDAGANGNTCTVTDNGDGTATIACDDGTTATVGDGQNGTSCTVTNNPDGSKTVECDDGTSVTITNGSNGSTCTIADNGDGTKTITCDDGTTVVVHDGADGSTGSGFRVTDLHGEDFLQSTGEFAAGKYMVDTAITSATADAAGTVTVNFTIANRTGGAPILDLAPSALTADIVKLEPPSGGESFSKWVAYVYQTETVVGDTYPNPAGTTAVRAYREGNGTLTNHGDGSYTYVFAANLTAAPVSYERNLLHRVAIMIGGHTGPTGDAWLDFVPDGSAPTITRDIIRTEACKECHGEEFAGHGGDRLHVEVCVTCHVPGSNDAQGGESLDMKQMIHKIHMGGELETVAGPDGNPWLTADNGTYAIWGYQNKKVSWEKVEFPAVIQNCTKCHSGAGANVANWQLVPSRDACQSCHDTLDIESPTTTHAAGQQTTDANCAVCHKPGGLEPIDVKHHFVATDPRDQAEVTFAVTMTPPTNGQYYTGNEAPVASIVISKGGVPIDHRILKGTAQGCVPTGVPAACAPDSDGKWAATGLFVNGPREHRMPALTTAARAQLIASAVGPFTFAIATSVTLDIDSGVDFYKSDSAHTRVPGVVTVAIPAGTYTADQLVTLLNGNAGFAARAIAYTRPDGKLDLRSRNLGPVHAIQLVAGDLTTAAFAGDVTVHAPTGSTPSNTLASAAASVGAIPAVTDDPKVTLFADHIEYQLDPVTDLTPGTYVLTLEVGQLGRVDDTNYRTPSVLKYPFQVGSATPELQVAGNCQTCHESGSGDGQIMDPARHHKIFDATAVDQCGACHDYQPQNPACPLGNAACGATSSSGYTGARPISKRVHAVHNGAALNYPVSTVDHDDTVPGRNWDIQYPRDVRDCQACHVDGNSSGTWATNPNTLACSGCHDGDAATTHMKLMTYDPTPTMPWSGDEQESCATCH